MRSSDLTHCFAVPGSHTIVDAVHPVTGLSLHLGETLEQVRVRYPGAELITLADYCAAKAARQDVPVVWIDSTEELYERCLGALPPAARSGGGFLVGEPYDHHAVSGEPRYDAFLYRDGRHLASSRPMTVAEFRAQMASPTLIPAGPRPA